MKIIEVLILALALACDCFVISVSKGLQVRRMTAGALNMALCFGAFQALMPCVTYFIGRQVYDYIAAYQPYIACLMLLAIGAHICYTSLRKDVEVRTHADYSLTETLLLAVATSIDALSAGVVLLNETTAAFMLDIALIGLASLALSLVGTAAGIKLGKHINFNVQLLAGILLIALGLWQLV